MANQITIVIPTILRDSVVRTVKKCARLAKKSNGLARVAVVVNCPQPNIQQQKTIRRLRRIKGVDIYLQEKFRVSAEQSAIHAAGFAKTNWIWFMGDDDIPSKGSLNHLGILINRSDADFWLLNCNLRVGSRTVPYYQVGPKPIQTSTGIILFERLGLISATTTLSCWLIKRELVDAKQFEQFHDVMGIYSHSFWLLSALHSKRAGLTDYKCVERNEEKPEAIAQSLTKYTATIGEEITYIWGAGLESLVAKACQVTGISQEQIWKFRELELYKTWLPKEKQLILVRRLASVIVDPGKSDGQFNQLLLAAPVRISIT